MKDNELRTQVKILKATDKIKNYYEIAELLKVSEKSFYNWLCGYFNLSTNRKEELQQIINILF